MECCNENPTCINCNLLVKITGDLTDDKICVLVMALCWLGSKQARGGGGGGGGGGGIWKMHTSS